MNLCICVYIYIYMSTHNYVVFHHVEPHNFQKHRKARIQRFHACAAPLQRSNSGSPEVGSHIR